MLENPIISALRKSLPPVFARAELTRLTGGACNSRTIANLQSLRQGPPAHKLGKRTVLEKEAFLSWLAARLDLGAK